MKTITLQELWSQIDERKAALSKDAASEAESLRNKGEHRTPAKRAMLERIAERCAKAGVEPFPAYY